MLSTWSNGKIDYKLFMTFYRDFLAAPFLIQQFLEKNGLEKNLFEVKYEDIVSSSSITVKSIYDWLGIPFNESVLELERNKKAEGIYGDDVYKKEPLKEIKSGSMNSWREILADKEMMGFFSEYQKFLSEEFVSKYGYSPEKFNDGVFGFGKNKFKEFVLLLEKTNRKSISRKNYSI